MDRIKLKISIGEARAIVEALRFSYGDIGMECPIDWANLARLIDFRLVSYEYAYGTKHVMNEVVP